MDYLEGLVVTVGHLAWPVTAIGLTVIARKELRKVLEALAKRIEDKGSAVSITKDGLEIKAVVEAQEARLVSLQVEQDQVRSLALRSLQSSGQPAAPLAPGSSTEAKARLREMADSYMNIQIPDYVERVRAKDVAAQEMALFVLRNGISRDELAQDKHEGLLLALAGAILLSPETGDAERLMKAATGAKRLHVRYRVLVATTKLMEKSLLPLRSLGAVRKLLYEYEEDADNALKRQIANVRALVNQAASEPS